MNTHHIFEITENPLSLFDTWMSDAKSAEPSDPDAACLATVDPDGMPNARMVLIRQIDERGFCFFTNHGSTKGLELSHHKKAAINFHWKSLKRQIRIRGHITDVSPAESDAYYQSRPLGNRIGAWASLQSQPLSSRDVLIKRVADFEQKFGDTPPRPEHWGGFRLSPVSIEFWEEGEFRLHNRVRYDKNTQDNGWITTRLYP